MSIDYSDMAFPKPGKKKKRKKHKKTILKTQKGICYLCALNGDYREKYTEEHHIMYGKGQREISEAEGLKVYLCVEHHRTGQQAAHNCEETREFLCRQAQEAFLKTHTEKEWDALFENNYL